MVEVSADFFYKIYPFALYILFIKMYIKYPTEIIYKGKLSFLNSSKTKLPIAILIAFSIISITISILVFPLIPYVFDFMETHYSNIFVASRMYTIHAYSSTLFHISSFTILIYMVRLRINKDFRISEFFLHFKDSLSSFIFSMLFIALCFSYYEIIKGARENSNILIGSVTYAKLVGEIKGQASLYEALLLTFKLIQPIIKDSLIHFALLITLCEFYYSIVENLERDCYKLF